MPATRPRPYRSHAPAAAIGVAVGALLMGALAPLVGTSAQNAATASPGFLDGSPAVGPAAGPSDAGSPGAPDAGAGPSPASGPDQASGTNGGNAQPGGGTGPGGSQTPGGQKGPSTTSAARPGAPLTASDVGVTPDTILVGAMTLNCEGCKALGVGVSDTPTSDFVKAYVRDINDRGGINGRKLQLATADYDPVKDAVSGGGTERAACLSLTEGSKVFAVLGGGTFGNPCVYREHRTPLITASEPGADDPATWNATDGNLWLTNSSGPRVLLDWARQLVGQQLVSKDKPFGIVVQEGLQYDLVKRYLIAELQRLGYAPAYIAVMPSNIATLSVRVSSEGTAMRSRHIDTVLMAVDMATTGPQWIQNAERNGWDPHYLLSDFPYGANDFFGGQQPASFDGAVAVSQTGEFSPKEARADPAIRHCIDVYEKAAGRPAATADLGNVVNFCAYFRAFELAAAKAGPVLTRKGFKQALASLGEFELPGAVGDRGSFGGAYGLGTVKWSAPLFDVTKVWTDACPKPDDTDHKCYVVKSGPYRMES